MKSFVRLLQRLGAGSAAARDGASNAAFDHALREYLSAASADDAAVALRLLRGQAPKRVLAPDALREAACRHAGVAPWLFDVCLQASGDWAETVTHLLPQPAAEVSPRLHEVLNGLDAIGHHEAGARADALLACCAPWDAGSREIALRIALGRWRRVVDDAVLRRALAAWSGADVRRLQLCWTAVVGARGGLDAARVLRLAAGSAADERALPWPMAAIEVLTETPRAAPGELLVHAWHGARRVQLVRRATGCWLWTDGGELLGAARWLAAAERLPADTVLQGELQVGAAGRWADRGALERWLAASGRRGGDDSAPDLVVHDVLEAAGRDLRDLPYRERWALLPRLLDGGAIVRSPAAQALDAPTFELRRRGFQGLLAMRLDAPQGVPGAMRLWRSPRPSLRAVVQSLQWAADADGRPGLELGLALWRTRAQGQRELPRLRDGHDLDALMALWAPIAKVWVDKALAAALEPAAELTLQRFGPLRLLRPERVCEVAFDALLANRRRRSGATLLGPVFTRWCEPMSLADVDELDRLREWAPDAQVMGTVSGS